MRDIIGEALRLVRPGFVGLNLDILNGHRREPSIDPVTKQRLALVVRANRGIGVE
jgi:hypothetical protein